MERKSDGTWHQWGLNSPGKAPPGSKKKDGSWVAVQGLIRKDFQWVPKISPPMPETQIFHSETSPLPKIQDIKNRNTHAGYIFDALDKKS